jgi:MerR family transcriptional regulator, thiopeptide resistance regulator
MDERSSEWSIQQVARIAGTTSRALRHYGDVGLLPATRIGANGYRYYDTAALVRLQRILLLRGLGLGIPAVAELLAGSRDSAEALRGHLSELEHERALLDRRIASVERTIDALEGGGDPMDEDMFDGFDHTVHEQEVVERWGRQAYADSDAWWRGMTDAERADWQHRQRALAADWTAAAERGDDPAGADAQALAARHAEWLRGIPGTPGYPDGPTAGYLAGLGAMYVADPRFSAHYGGEAGAAFVRDALAAYADRLAE